VEEERAVHRHIYLQSQRARQIDKEIRFIELR
jgi:hypothetical protein